MIIANSNVILAEIKTLKDKHKTNNPKKKGKCKKECDSEAETGTIVYSLISGPQTFSDFFYIMKICEETVLCN